MTQAAQGGPAATVYQVASRQGVVGRDAQRVVIVTDGRAAEGGPQQAAYFVTDAEIAAGEFIPTGNKPLPIVLVGAAGAEHPPMAYYDVTGKPDDVQPSQNPPVAPVPLLDLESDMLILSEGDPVATWADQSGNHYDFTATGDARPTYHTGGGIPYVEFDGIDDWMIGSDFGNWDSFTVFCVINMNSFTGNEFMVSKQNSVSYRGWFLEGALFQINDGLTNNFITLLEDDTFDAVYIRTGERIAGTNMHIYTNGSNAGESTLNAGTVASITTSSALALAASGDDGPASVMARFYAVRIYTPALDATQRATVEAELAARYGITL